MRFLAALSVSAVLCLASAVPAVAADSGSAIDQYRENIPAGGSAKKPSAKERKALESQGEDGKQLAEVLGAAGAADDGSSGSGTASGSGTSDGGAPANGSDAAAGDGSGDANGGGGRSAGDAASGAARGSGDGSRGSGGGSAGSGADGGTSSPSTTGRSSDESPVATTVAASLGSDFGPAKLWVALVAVLIAAVGVAVVRRRSA
ncbi:hypothetical protein [Patulibacter sp.]|uniref:hypothetical protein n=1 Tax=Patulibacter sp. TaxID=1912859 RepID=UPI002725FBB8|nr:hypothetical protein [Patulibacter sp.]MDO9410779.1 hypothetical protein [Patulibacter sp.]